MPEHPQILLVDGHALAYRSFHAIQSLTSPNGNPTNAIFGFIKTLEKLRKQTQPTGIAVVWDGGLAAERLTLLPTYKAQRPPMPAALAQQIDPIVEWLGAAGLCSLCREGVEADDWIATLAGAAELARIPTVIYSSDKDFMQLVSPTVGLLVPGDKSALVWTESNVRSKTGVAPAQIVDWLSLVGDTVDNIPGVPGVGPKTASELLARFGSGDAIYDALDQVSSARIRDSLRSHHTTFERNRMMIRLRPDLAPPCSLDSLKTRPQNTTQLAGFYDRWGFRGLRHALDTPETQQATLDL
jgi:DNA polymerase-1